MYLQKFENADQLQEAFNLALQIQNEGIATTFVWHNGHINNAEIKLYFPEWQRDARPDVEFEIKGSIGIRDEDTYNRDRNAEAINHLRLILQARTLVDSLGNVIDYEAQRREERRKQFEALKQEFLTTA